MWAKVLSWLAIEVNMDKDVIANNPWIFSNDVYLNNMGTARKLKGFYKKCIELATNKKYFEERLKECE